MTESLDLADRRILFELDCNSRQSLSELARRVRLGRDLVSYRLERLQQQGILNRCAILVNPYKLGMTVYKTYLKVETNRARVAELIAALDRHPNTYWLAETSGEWDIVFSILARTPKEFYDFQNQIFSDFSDILINFSVHTLVNYWWFPKKYLLGSRWQEERQKLDLSSERDGTIMNGWGFHEPEFTFGTTPDEYLLDDLESGILELLRKDSRLSYADLAERLNSTPAIVKYRMEKLQERGVIAGYRVDLDLSALGMTLFKVLVHQRDYDVKKELEFREFCRDHPNISCYVQQIGSHKVEFEVQAKDYQQFNAIMDEVRERFAKYIRTMDYIVIRRDHHHRTPCSVFAGRRQVSAAPLIHQPDSRLLVAN